MQKSLNWAQVCLDILILLRICIEVGLTNALVVWFGFCFLCRDLSHNQIATVHSHTFLNLPALRKV